MQKQNRQQQTIPRYALGVMSACLSLWLTACATTDLPGKQAKPEQYQPPANLLLVKQPPAFPLSLTNGELYDLAKVYYRGWQSCNDDKVGIAEDAGKVLAPPETVAPVEKKWWQFWK